jgi:hypothetical protein
VTFQLDTWASRGYYVWFGAPRQGSIVYLRHERPKFEVARELYIICWSKISGQGDVKSGNPLCLMGVYALTAKKKHILTCLRIPLKKNLDVHLEFYVHSQSSTRIFFYGLCEKDNILCYTIAIYVAFFDLSNTSCKKSVFSTKLFG